MVKLPRKVEGDRLGASHINKLSTGVEKIEMINLGGYGGGHVGGKAIIPPPFVQQSVVIADLGCDDDDDIDVYTIRPKYWDPLLKEWKIDMIGEGFCLDDRQGQTGYWMGDTLQAYYDPQRGAYVPCHSERRIQIQLMSDLYAAKNTKNDPSMAYARVLRRFKPNGHLKPTTRVELIVNRLEKVQVEAGRYAKAEERIGEWQLYVADCPGGSDSFSSESIEST